MRVNLAALLVATSLSAQNVHVQPLGYAGVEGNSSTTIAVSHLSARVHQADGDRIGLPMPAITSMSFRRDRGAGATATARTITVTVLLGETTFAIFSSTFATNWLAAPATVYTTKATNLPDITFAPPAFPAPFVVTIPFDTPGVYLGVNPLLWELVIDNGTTAAYSLDWVSGATTTSGATSTALGTGCTTPNGAMSLTTSFTSTTTNLNLSFSTLRAPANAQVVLVFGLTNPNLSIPGLCSPLYTDAVASATLGTAGATGTLAAQILSFPWSDVFSGVTLYSQLVSLDATQSGLPIALSNGRQSPLPPTSGGPAPTNCRRTYSIVSSSALTGVAVSSSAVVTKLTY